MCDHYYLMTKDIGIGPQLIGILERVDRDNYQFRYMIAADKFPSIIFHISGMDDTHKVYNTEETWRSIMCRIVPSKDSLACKLIEEQRGYNHDDYNVWDFLNKQVEFYEEFLKPHGKKEPYGDPYERFYLYKEIPERAIRYD